jgi:hypothetical protein
MEAFQSIFGPCERMSFFDDGCLTEVSILMTSACENMMSSPHEGPLFFQRQLASFLGFVTRKHYSRRDVSDMPLARQRVRCANNKMQAGMP